MLLKKLDVVDGLLIEIEFKIELKFNEDLGVEKILMLFFFDFGL